MTPDELTIGTDPELLCVDVREETPINVRNYYSQEDPFGADGHPYLAELRPKAASCPRQLVNNVRNTLMLGWSQLKAAHWRVSPWALEKPMGGHIHFGIPFEERYLNALDNQFGIVMGLVEPELPAKDRRTLLLRNPDNGWVAKHPYGLLGDYRTKPWGFEYRTPSSFITTPGVSLGFLAIAKALIYEEMVGGRAAWSQLTNKQKAELQFSQKDFINMNKEVFTKLGKSLLPHLENMEYFKTKEGKPLWSVVMYLMKQVARYKGYYVYKDIKAKWTITDDTVKQTLDKLKEEPGEFRVDAPREMVPPPILIQPEIVEQLRLRLGNLQRIERFANLNAAWRIL